MSDHCELPHQMPSSSPHVLGFLSLEFINLSLMFFHDDTLVIFVFSLVSNFFASTKRVYRDIPLIKFVFPAFSSSLFLQLSR